MKIFYLVLLIFFCGNARAQLVVTNAPNGQALAQRLVGEGVTISNVTFTGNPLMAGVFTNQGNTNIGIDSGIVLTNGIAKTNTSANAVGVDGNGTTSAITADAHNEWFLPGDSALANLIGSPVSEVSDACILEFDFQPLGDTIRFRYVFSSEEYAAAFVCDYNDAFAFFISGPGFAGAQNIALVPGTSTPVSIRNVNDIPAGCINNPSYFISNISNRYLTHDGLTVVFTAVARVQPCQTYHLKLVIADAGTDGDYDSGVFLEAKSLTSNATTLLNATQTDPVSGSSYLVEGCVAGSVRIKRQYQEPVPLTINLSYGGTAVNGVDLQTLPGSVTIPAGQDSVLLNIVPLIDGLSEGIESLTIYTLAGCSGLVPTDSTTLQIRDYDILGIVPDSVIICGNSSVQLQATPGYTTYQWDVNPALSSTTISNPVATPTSSFSTFICVATIGTCNAKDSAFVTLKKLNLLSKTDVNCPNASTGVVAVTAGAGWLAPLQFSINAGNWQADSVFNNLPVGTYNVVVKDASGCADSVQVTLVQAFADMTHITTITPASCSGNADGTINITTSGGSPAYQYSIDGTQYQSLPQFLVRQGSYNLLVRDANGCNSSISNISIPLNNTLTVDAGLNDTICEGKSTRLSAVSAATSYSWQPAASLASANTASPVASPTSTTQYIVTASLGICTQQDSVTIFVSKAPTPNGGADATICFGASTILQASGAVAYSWSPSNYLSNAGNATPTVQRPQADMVYQLHVVDINGCSSLVPDTVKVFVTPAVKLFAGNDSLFVAMGQPVQLQASQVGASTVTSYQWSPAYGLNRTDVSNPVATLDRDITYYVTGSTPANCEGSDTIRIKVYKGPEIYVPTAFTPNGDQVNDVLRAYAIGMKSYNYFRVYNRLGQLIFATADFNKGWDGRIRGVVQNTGSFVWMAEAVDYRGNVIQRKGTTTIIR
ncbi:MAG: T9SS type B sorting domain-containing protein [Sphingobacteriales bacterium]|nr:MAG: T9SS type B sorting domain-containing protein [Sphingobacteriales bacterium]